MIQNAFNEILDSLENDDMWLFAKKLINTIPPYIYEVGASSSGKYHPYYAQNKYGLIRHTIALVRFLNHTFAIQCMNHWTSRERDILRIAGLMHDSRKSGSQTDYEANKNTKHEHPLFAAEIVRGFLGCGTIPDKEIKLIASTIETHMGEWRVSQYSQTVLPAPKTEMQKLLHWADYLASRKDIEVKFEGALEVKDNPFILNGTMSFGKYQGMSYKDVFKKDPEYMYWLRDKANMEIWEPLKSFLENLP